jgi:glutathione S-transferase
LKYATTHVDISKGTQKEDWYLKINPNGRIPAIIDHTEGKEKRVFEGMAIMLYLCQKYDVEGKISYPFDSDRYVFLILFRDHSPFKQNWAGLTGEMTGIGK